MVCLSLNEGKNIECGSPKQKRNVLGVKVNSIGNAYVCVLNDGEKSLTKQELDAEISKFR